MASKGGNSVNYRTLSLPESLVNQVEKRIRDGEEYIKKHPEKGYTGVTEFFKEALRDKLFENVEPVKRKKP